MSKLDNLKRERQDLNDKIEDLEAKIADCLRCLASNSSPGCVYLLCDGYVLYDGTIHKVETELTSSQAHYAKALKLLGVFD